FQAEDGIRDFHVTGVQTCALPISVAQTVARGSILQFTWRSVGVTNIASPSWAQKITPSPLYCSPAGDCSGSSLTLRPGNMSQAWFSSNAMVKLTSLPHSYTWGSAQMLGPVAA